MKCFLEKTKSYAVSAAEVKENKIFTVKSLYHEYTAENEANTYVEDHNVSAVNCDNKIANFKEENEGGCDFEAAIKATHYGKYNWFLLFICLWGYMSTASSTSSMSFILPSADCDLQLTAFDKGMLNAAVYLGMLASAFFWSLVADSLGRRIVLLVGFGLDAVFCILIGLSQSFGFLLFFKLLSGFINSSLIAILSTFVAENHANKYRATVTVGTGIFFSFGSIVLPFLAWLIIPLPFRWTLFNGFIYLPSWRIFLLATAVPSMLTFICLLFSDESPKFLMSQNRNEEALKVFQKIYSLNTGNATETFPIKSLKIEHSDHSVKLEKGKFSFKNIIQTGWEQVYPIFQKPYIYTAILPCAMQFCTLLSMNTIRLWAPQLFALAIEHENSFKETASTLCDLIISNSEGNVTKAAKDCSEKIVDEGVYFNAMITGLVTATGYIISGYLVKLIDRKWLLIIVFLLGMVGCLALYWSASSIYLLAVISVFTSVTSTAATAISSVTIDIFPTFLRATALSWCITCGRLGAIIGNLVFPILLSWNCLSTFIFLAFSLLIAGVLALFLPETKGKELV